MNIWLKERITVPALWITVFIACLGFPSRAGAQLIRTVAGGNNAGYSGDGGPASNALLQNPFGTAVDSAGNVYIADSSNNRVRVVNMGSNPITIANVSIQPGNIATVAGNGTAGFSGDGSPATSAQLNNPSGVAVDSNGNIYIADLNNFRVRKVGTNGIITTVTGNGSGAYGGDYGPATNGTLFPFSVAVDPTGNLYIADTGNQRIRVVNMGSTGIILGGIFIQPGYIASVAGTGVEGFAGDGGLAGSAEFDNPYSVAVDSNRNIYICDTYNRRIRVMNTGTSPITVAGVTIQPANIATVAGIGTYGYKGDGGPATSAQFADPDGVAVDSAGNIYVSDLEAERIRFISNSTGIASTIAGSSVYGYNGDNIPATTAEMSYPRSLAIDGAGNVFFADEPNQRIREVIANTGSFTSRANTAFTVGTAATFAVTTNNAPLPVLTVTGTLPNGIHFVDNRNGTGTLGGTPAAGSDGAYNITFTASNGVFPNTIQNFTLTVYAAGGAPAGSAAAFVSQDITTHGNWESAYGGDGYYLMGVAPQLPAYATVTVQNQSNYTWGINPIDPRALQIPGTSGSIAATWFNPVSFNLDVNVGTGSHPVTIYLLDWDSKGRSETIQVLDADSGAPLDTRFMSGFDGGVYLTWNITGHVQIVATVINPPNAIISGIFFGNKPTGGGGGGGTGGATPFLIAYTSGEFRNNFSGWIGMKLTVGSSALNVSSVARICVSGDAGTHTAKFVDAATGADVPGGSVSLNMAGCTVGQFVYGALPNVLLLPSGASYYLVSLETAGGDPWYDNRPLVSTTAAAVNSSIYSADGAHWLPTGTTNTSYGPPNFLYTTVPSTPVTVTVQSNPAGASYSVDGTNYVGIQVFNWTAGALHTIAAASSQSSGAGTQYKWSNWSDGGAMSHAVAPTADTIYTVNFSTQFQLSSSVSPTGAGFVTANPPSATGFYDIGTQVQLTATQSSPVCSFSSWTGDASGSTNPQTVTMTAARTATAGFQCSSPPANNFLTGYALNGPALRNNFNGWVGMKFTVGSAALSVSSLGRICVAGNLGTHTVKLVNANTGADVPQGSVSVSMSGCTAGQFKYASLGSLTLLANTAYYLVSQESSDQWYDYGALTTTSVAVVNNSIYSNGASWASTGIANTSYVPLNFVYAVIPPGPADLTISTTHSGNFVQGDPADTYTINVGNSGASATNAAVSVGVTVPSGLTATGITGSNWTCTQPAGPCSRSDALAGGSYPALTLTVAVASNAPSSVTTTVVVSGGGETNTSNDTASDPTTVDPPGSTSSFVTAYALNSPAVRNNYSGWVGMQFTVGSNPLTVSSLGRACIAGNFGIHALKLVNAVTGLDVPNGVVSLNMAGCTPGQFKYGLLTTVTLQANTAYYLVSPEISGADQWYDYGRLTTTSVAAVNGSVYSNGTGWSTINTPNTSYVPVSFIYATAAPPPPPPPGPADLTIGVTHSGNFVQADAADTYTITVGNSGGSATNASVSVSLTVPTGLIPTGVAGAGWTCTQPAGPCSRGDALAVGVNYPLTLTVGVASNASSPLITTAVVSGGGETNTSNDTANDSTTVDPSGGGPVSGTSFVTAYALNGPSIRNNFSGWVGMKFSVGSTSLSVSSLGRMCIAGNAGTHAVKIVNATTGLDVASVSLNMAGCIAGQFKYASLSLNLPGNTAYYLVSQETSGGDQWYDYGTLTATSAAAVNGSVYSNGASWAVISTPNTSYVPVSFLYAAGPPDTTLLSGFSPASNLRNDFTGWVGTKFTVGSANVTVHSLGRIFATGNSGTHTVKIVLAADGSNVPGASVSLSMPGGTPGQFWYADLAAPVTLQANTSYYLVSQEQAGGDAWYDYGLVSPTSLAAVNNAVYFDGTKWVLVGGANYSYVPLDFK